MKSTAAIRGLNLQPVLQAQTFSLLVSAVENGTAAAFLPEDAAHALPEQRFALVSAEGMSALNAASVWFGMPKWWNQDHQFVAHSGGFVESSRQDLPVNWPD